LAISLSDITPPHYTAAGIPPNAMEPGERRVAVRVLARWDFAATGFFPYQ
jgi:hypothetical protein